MAQHHRLAAAEGGHEACDLRLRRLVEVHLQAGGIPLRALAASG
jgi:hypothetical protein